VIVLTCCTVTKVVVDNSRTLPSAWVHQRLTTGSSEGRGRRNLSHLSTGVGEHSCGAIFEASRKRKKVKLAPTDSELSGLSSPLKYNHGSLQRRQLLTRGLIARSFLEVAKSEIIATLANDSGWGKGRVTFICSDSLKRPLPAAIVCRGASSSTRNDAFGEFFPQHTA
jgi:hypothetical protein